MLPQSMNTDNRIPNKRNEITDNRNEITNSGNGWKTKQL